MLEILLVKEKDLNCIDLVNIIHSLDGKSRLYKIVENKNDIEKIILNHTIDIIIIDYNIFKDFNIIEFINIIKK